MIFLLSWEAREAREGKVGISCKNVSHHLVSINQTVLMRDARLLPP